MHKPELRLQAPLALNNARIATASRAPRTRITHQLRASTALRLMFRATAWSGVSIAIMSSASANPTGGNVVSGQASINQANPNRTEITQTTDRAAINWQSYSIGANQYTVFFQPSAASVALNRVLGPDPSVIAGHLQANGNLILINRNGVLFSAGSQVNVHSIVATTADIRDRDFNAGRFKFSIPSPNPNATVVNEGTITVADHGLAALVAPGTRNSGVITAKFGRVMLAGAQTFTVDLYGDGLLSFDITSKVKGANVSNTGQLQADGGVIQLSASSVDDIVTGVINMGGTIAANTVVAQTGTITADASATGQLTVTGQISAQGANPGETGGAITLTGGNVAVTGGASIDASGSAGGGSIKAGGGFHGSDPSVANAQTTTIAANATLDASAVQQGDGGAVVVWSDKKTSFAGTIRAKGGAKGGDGGKAEVSSKGVLAFTGAADLGAPMGKAGNLLLDPSELDIITPGTDTANLCTTTAPFSCTAPGSGGSTLTNTTLDGLLNSATVTLNADTIDFKANVTGTGTLNASAANTIGLDPTVTVTSNGAPLNVNLSITGSGAAVTGVALSTNSAISTGGGSLSIAAGIGALSIADNTVALTSSGGALSLSAPRLALTGTINAGTLGTLSLTATDATTPGTITESAATITAGTLTGSTAGGLVNLASIGSTNTIAALGAFTTVNGGFSLADASALTVSGAVNAGSGALSLNVAGALGVGANLTGGSVALTATGASGSITQTAGTITGTTSVALNAGAAISQSGGATISTATLTGSSVGGTTLNSANIVGAANLSNTTSGDISLTDASALAVTGISQSGGNVSLTDTGGAITVSSAITVTGGNLALIAPSLVLSSALSANAVTLTANGAGTSGTVAETGSISAASLTGSSTGSATLTGTNTIGTLSVFTITAGDLAFTDSQTLHVTGNLSASGGVTLTTTGTGDIDVAASIGGTTVALDSAGAINQTLGTISGAASVALNAGGAISQTGGATISATTLTGASTGGASLTDANQITNLGNFANAGGFSLTDATALAVTGNVATGGSALSLSVTGAAFNVAGTLNSGAGSTTITATGEGMNVGGAVAPGLAVGDASLDKISATGGLTLATQGGNDIAVGTVTNHAGFSALTLNSGNNISLSGPLAVGGATSTLNLIADGTITEGAGGTITVATLTGHLGADVLLTNANAVGDLGTFTVGGVGNFNLNDGATALSVSGTATVPGVLTLNAGSITELAGGSIVASKLTGAASVGDVKLTNTNAIGDLGAFAVTTGNFALNDGTTPLNIDGVVNVPGILTLNAGAITETGAGAVTAGTLTGSSGAVSLVLNSNNIANLGDFAVATDFNLNNDGNALAIIGAVNAPNTLTLNTGTITETGVGTISAGTLTGSSTGAVVLNTNPNAVHDLGAFSATDFNLNDGPTALTINGAVSVTGTLTLAAGSITELSGGTVAAAILTGVSTGDVSLTNTNAITNIGNFATGGGNFALTDGGPLTLTGALNAGPGSVTINAAGTITETGGTITAAVLNGSSLGNTTLTGANTIGSLGSFNTGGGDFAITDATSLTLTGALNAGTGTVTLVATGAATTISESTGTITAGTLTGGTAGGAVTLADGGNTIADLGSFANGGGNFALTDGGPLTLTGALNAGTGAVTLNAGGTITETGGTITAAALNGSSTGDTTLADANTIGSLGNFITNGGAFTLTDGSALTVAGNVATGGGNISLTVPGPALAITGTLNSGGGTTTIAAQAGTALVAGADAAAPAGSLQISDASLANITAGALVLDTTGSADIFVNGVGAHPGFNGVTLNSGQDVHFDFDVAGSTFASSLTANGRDIALNGNLAVGTTLALNATGTITQTAGFIKVPTLTGTSTGGMTLNDANLIGHLGPFINHGPGSIALTDAQALTVAGVVDAGTQDLTLNVTGNLGLGADLDAGGTVALNVSGTVTQTGGIITAASLTGHSTGGTTLGDANRIAALGPFTNSTGVGFSLTNAETLTVAHAVDAGGGDLTLHLTAGNLILNDNLAAASGLVTLNVDGGTITQNAGAITAVALTGHSAVGTSLGDTNHIAVLRAFTNSGAGGFTLTDAQPLTVTGPVSAGSQNLALNVTGDLGIVGDLSAGNTVALNTSGAINQTGGTISGGTVALDAGGVVLQTGGGIVATTLTGFSTGGTTLGLVPNQVTDLGPFTNNGSGGFNLNDATGLTVTGPVNAGSGNLTLGVAGNLAVGDNLIAGNTVTLDAAGAINQTAGTITANTLTGFSTGGASFTDANHIAALNGFTNTGAGSFNLTDAQALNVTGAVAAGTDNLTLNVTGALGVGANLAAGSTVTLNASGAINQTVGTISGATVALDAGGAISQTGTATITAGTLTGMSNGGTTLDNNNLIANLGPFTNSGAGDIVLADNQALTVIGAVAAGNGNNNLGLLVNGDLRIGDNLSAGDTMALFATGAITQTAGSITANTLGTLSQGGTTLAQPNNQFANLALALNAGSGDVVIKDNQPLTISGLFLNNAGLVAIQSTGMVTLGASTFGATAGVEIGSTGITQTGAATFLSPTPLVVLDATGATLPQAVNPATGAAMLASFHPGGASGNIDLTNIAAPSVLLAANHGHMSGSINAHNLAVFGEHGSAQLTGTVDNVSGPTAAQLVDKSGQPENQYRFNGCAIRSVTCTVLPAIVPAKPALLNSVSILSQQQQFTDPTVNLLNVGSEDLF